MTIPNSSETDLFKVPPHSLEAEQAVIGGLMLDTEAWEKVSTRVFDVDFYRAEHRVVFATMKQLFDNNHPLDIITLCAELENNGTLENAGGQAYLARLALDTVTAANITAYADIVRERSVLRQLIKVGTDVANSGFLPEGRKSNELLQEAEKAIFAIAEQSASSKQDFQSINTLVTMAMERIEELFKNPSSITGLPTGWADFDEMTSGLQPGDMVVVAGRPSMGKTTFAMNIVEHAAFVEDKLVAVFSMEMPGEQLIMRSLSSMGRIDQTHLRKGELTDQDWKNLVSTTGILANKKLFIDDSPALSPDEVRARARRLQREQGKIGLIMIDYLQLMQVHGTSENRVNEVSEISRSIKAMAKELEVPVIALSQLSRNLEQRPNKRPQMSDLRESGAIEQDADLICFIYRDEVYNKETDQKGIAEIIIGKQRNGPIGTIKLMFQGKYTRFDNLAPDAYQDYGDM